MLGGNCCGGSGTTITGAERVIRYAVGTAATQDSVTKIPADAIVLEAWLDVQTPYTAGTTISIGQAGNLTLLQTATDNDPLTAAIYQVTQDTDWGGVALVVRTTVAGGPVAGDGFVVVRFAVPDP